MVRHSRSNGRKSKKNSRSSSQRRYKATLTEAQGRAELLDALISALEHDESRFPQLFTTFKQKVLRGQREWMNDTAKSVMYGFGTTGLYTVFDGINNVGRLFFEDAALWFGNACVILSMIANDRSGQLRYFDSIKDILTREVVQTPFCHKYIVHAIFTVQEYERIHLPFYPNWISQNVFHRPSVRAHITIVPDQEDKRFSYAEKNQTRTDLPVQQQLPHSTDTTA